MKKTKFIKIIAFSSCVLLSLSMFLTLGAGAVAAHHRTDEATLYDGESVYHEPMAQSLPEGTVRTGINVNGRRVLEGRVFVIDGVTYVPMFKFADWLGMFTYTTSQSGNISTGKVKGENLEITAVEDSLYISANGRYFYTVSRVLELAGELYIPIEPMVKALNCHIGRDAGGAYVVRSGDTRLLKSADRFYREDEVYWLSKIISAESRGESLEGKIAVGNVVLNRVRSAQFPNTIYGVIFDKKFGVQFTPVANGTIYQEPTAESVIAAKICLEGYTLSNEALYFLNPKYSTASWVQNNREFAFTIGNHSFYN